METRADDDATDDWAVPGVAGRLCDGDGQAGPFGPRRGGAEQQIQARQGRNNRWENPRQAAAGARQGGGTLRTAPRRAGPPAGRPPSAARPIRRPVAGDRPAGNRRRRLVRRSPYRTADGERRSPRRGPFDRRTSLLAAALAGAGDQFEQWPLGGLSNYRSRPGEPESVDRCLAERRRRTRHEAGRHRESRHRAGRPDTERAPLTRPSAGPPAPNQTRGFTACRLFATVAQRAQLT